MARPDKAAAVAELTEKFSTSNAAVLTEYRGLTVKHLLQLRRSLGADASYAVAKNTLTSIAARQAGIEGLEIHLAGPTAIAFISGDVATVAKGLRDFAKANPLLVIKAGVMDGRVLNADEVKKLADLESREVLLAKLAGALKGSLQQAVSLFAAPLSQAVRTFAALESAAQDNPSLLASASPAPAEPTTEPESAEPANSEATAEETGEASAAAAAPEAAPAAEVETTTDAATAAEDTAADAADEK